MTQTEWTTERGAKIDLSAGRHTETGGREMADYFERKGEWSGYAVTKAKTGFVVNYRSQIQGELTERRILLPYGTLGMGKDVDLAAPYNDLHTTGDVLATAPLGCGEAQVLRKGRIVQ